MKTPCQGELASSPFIFQQARGSNIALKQLGDGRIRFSRNLDDFVTWGPDDRRSLRQRWRSSFPIRRPERAPVPTKRPALKAFSHSRSPALFVSLTEHPPMLRVSFHGADGRPRPLLKAISHDDEVGSSCLKGHPLVTRLNQDDTTPSASGAEIDALIVKGKADPTAVRTLRCRTVAEGRFRQLNYIRNLPAQSVMKAEPEGLLAETIAPNASEALLAAFGSCLAVGIHANAIAQSIPIRSLELELEADINTTAVWGAGDLHPKTIGFESVQVKVCIDADVPRELLEALIAHTCLWSPVANTLHNPVHLDVTLEASVPPATSNAD